jgi:hypothetical protein
MELAHFCFDYLNYKKELRGKEKDNAFPNEVHIGWVPWVALKH